MAEVRELLSGESLANVGYERIQKESHPMMGTHISVRVGRRKRVGTVIGLPGEDFGIARLNGKTKTLTTECYTVRLGGGKIVLVRPPKVKKDEDS